MKTEVIAELLEENERLRERLKGQNESAMTNGKFSDFIFLIVMATAYFGLISFVLHYAFTGILYTISVNPETDITAIVGIYLLCNVFLYFVGAVVTIGQVASIYRDELTDFVYRVCSAVARTIEESDDEDEFDCLDEEIAQHIEEEIKKDLIPKKVAKKRSPQPRGPHGEFASKKKSVKKTVGSK